MLWVLSSEVQNPIVLIELKLLGQSIDYKSMVDAVGQSMRCYKMLSLNYHHIKNIEYSFIVDSIVTHIIVSTIQSKLKQPRLPRAKKFIEIVVLLTAARQTLDHFET